MTVPEKPQVAVNWIIAVKPKRCAAKTTGRFSGHARLFLRLPLHPIEGPSHSLRDERRKGENGLVDASAVERDEIGNAIIDTDNGPGVRCSTTGGYTK